MKKASILLILLACLIACESVNYVPPVTSQMAAATKGRRVDVATLRDGRTLLVHRCIECHTLPPLWHYAVEDWPEIVNSMAHRANLRPAERDAIVAYVLAVRSPQSKNPKTQRACKSQASSLTVCFRSRD